MCVDIEIECVGELQLLWDREDGMSAFLTEDVSLQQSDVSFVLRSRLLHFAWELE